MIDRRENPAASLEYSISSASAQAEKGARGKSGGAFSAAIRPADAYWYKKFFKSNGSQGSS